MFFKTCLRFSFLLPSLSILFCSSSSKNNPVTVNNSLSAPVLESPTNGASGQATSLTLSWESVDDAASYRVQVSTVSTFVSTVSSQTGVTGLAAWVSGLANSATYYWKVSAANAGGTSAWSIAWNFTTVSANYIPDTVSTFLPDTDMDTLIKLGMTVNTGSSPPNIDGDYYIAIPTLLSSNIPTDNVGMTFDPMSQEFYNQTTDLHISEAYNQSGMQTGQGTGVFISGSGNNFTVYVPENGVLIQGVDTVAFKNATLYSGTLTPAGIYNYQIGFICTWKGPDPDGIVIQVGQSRVIVSSDSLAEAVSSYPYNAVAKSRNSIRAFLMGKRK
jgi:hypothetical protein